MSIKHKIYVSAKKSMPRLLAVLIALPMRMLANKQQHLYLLQLEELILQKRQQLLLQQQDWGQLLAQLPHTESALIIGSAAEQPWCKKLCLLLQQQHPGGNFACAQLNSSLQDRTSDERYSSFVQGLDWDQRQFPLKSVYKLVIISPSIASLNHRTSLLEWLKERYQSKLFFLRLPMLIAKNDRIYRSFLGAKLARQNHYQVLYTPKSARFEFSPYFRFNIRQNNPTLGELWCLLKHRHQENQHQKVVSIVIPVYKTEKFIHQCFSSIQNQTWTNFEVLVIDDASPDNSGKIVLDFCQQDHRFKLIRLENNCGQAAARNLGLNSAKGDYICFIDSDDFIHRYYLETMARALDQTHVDFVVCDLDEEHHPGPTLHCYRYFEKKRAGDFILPFESPYLLNAPWNKMFKRQLLLDSKLSFDEGHYYEDLPYLFSLTLKTKRHFFIPMSLIHYRHRPDSESRAPLTRKNIIDLCFAITTVKEQLQQLGSFFNQDGLQRYLMLLNAHLLKLCGTEMLMRPDLTGRQKKELALLAWQHSQHLFHLAPPTKSDRLEQLLNLIGKRTQKLSSSPSSALSCLSILQKQLALLLNHSVDWTTKANNLPRYF